jgi:hypothetical protein
MGLSFHTMNTDVQDRQLKKKKEEKRGKFQKEEGPGRIRKSSGDATRLL